METKLDRKLRNKSRSGAVHISPLSVNDVSIGLNPTRMEADMANPEWQVVIEKNRALAQDLGIAGTPGFIVGNELVPGALDLNGLKELIARAGQGQ